MDYLPYHRKYRPKRISEYIGNERVKKSVLAALRGNNRPQVLLFQGHAGCGKTTMARLVAKEYLCENRDEETGACGECYNCKQMEDYIESGDTGMLINVREIDVTDSNKKQDIDELLEDASIPSFDGSWKIYILDECHVMSNSAQNRLLKNLEEPAQKVLMILCTTDPDKLLPTILSRCQYTFKVTKPSRDELGNLLARVCRNEGVEYEPKALSLICVKGEFVPRKSLVVLEQVVREKQSVTYQDTLEVLNLISDRHFFDFYDILLAENIDVFRYITFVGRLKSEMDLKQFVESLIDFTVRGIYISNGVSVEALDKSEIDQYKRLFKRFSVKDIAHLLDLLLKLKNSQDIEARLLLLGYTGLKRDLEGKDVLEDFADPKLITPAKEKRVGNENYLKSITATEEEKQDLIESMKKPVSEDILAKLFNGVKIVDVEQ